MSSLYSRTFYANDRQRHRYLCVFVFRFSFCIFVLLLLIWVYYHIKKFHVCTYLVVKMHKERFLSKHVTVFSSLRFPFSLPLCCMYVFGFYLDIWHCEHSNTNRIHSKRQKKRKKLINTFRCDLEPRDGWQCIDKDVV